MSFDRPPIIPQVHRPRVNDDYSMTLYMIIINGRMSDRGSMTNCDIKNIPPMAFAVFADNTARNIISQGRIHQP